MIWGYHYFWKHPYPFLKALLSRLCSFSRQGGICDRSLEAISIIYLCYIKSADPLAKREGEASGKDKTNANNFDLLCSDHQPLTFPDSLVLLCFERFRRCRYAHVPDWPAMFGAALATPWTWILLGSPCFGTRPPDAVCGALLGHGFAFSFAVSKLPYGTTSAMRCGFPRALILLGFCCFGWVPYGALLGHGFAFSFAVSKMLHGTTSAMRVGFPRAL